MCGNFGRLFEENPVTLLQVLVVVAVDNVDSSSTMQLICRKYLLMLDCLLSYSFGVCLSVCPIGQAYVVSHNAEAT